MKVVFWNSKSWDAQKAEKIAYVTQTEGADVVCILDARIDKTRLRYIKNYEKIIEDKTGKKWRGYSALKSKAKKCRAGGTLIFVSDMCTRVKVFPLIEFGVATRLSCQWKGEEVQITAVYRPCENGAEGSLRTAAMSIVKGNLDDVIWGRILSSTGGGAAMVGGDFNLNEVKIDERLRRSGDEHMRCKLEGGGKTFRKINEKEGSISSRVIDHVLLKGVEGHVKVTEEGLFINDHNRKNNDRENQYWTTTLTPAAADNNQP